MFKIHYLTAAAVCAALLSCLEASAQSNFALSRDSRIQAPPVVKTTGETDSHDILKSLPTAGISINTSNFMPAADNEKYAYLKNNTVRIKEQLGSGFDIVQDKMFILVSDTEKNQNLKKTLATLRICRNALQRSYFNTPLRNPVTVFAFKDKQSYRYNLKRLWQEEPISPYGHFNYVRKHIIFNLSTGLGTMIHELTHSLMDPDMPRAPIWIAEGMATLFEECVVDGSKISGAVNWRLPELSRKIDTDEYTPLARLITLSDRQFKTKESLHYAEARYLCMFFESRGCLSKIYQSFRDNYRQDKTGRIFIEKAFGKKLADIEDEWKIWVKTLRYQPAETFSAK
ncbi:MAG: hypothetical protein ACYTFY_09585 [Planctomycetota bacterium]|jgi:hypothetical protein